MFKSLGLIFLLMFSSFLKGNPNEAEIDWKEYGFAKLEIDENFSNVVTQGIKSSLRSKSNQPRDYLSGPTKYQKSTLNWIIKATANESILWLTKNRKKMIAKGETILDLHPLNFLLIIFTDEELKCCVHKIRERTVFVTVPFYKGITDSLAQEAACNNLKTDYIHDFAKKVKIDSPLILPFVQSALWREFVDCLIDKIPRENDPNRYNM
jgi:hypothetical protein